MKTALAPSSARRGSADEIPAGTEFTVRLTTPIGTSFSFPGDVFVVETVTPLRSASGRLLVREGSPAKGRVVGLDEGPAASLRIEFESIETEAGRASLSATVQAEPSVAAHYRTEPIYSTALPYAAVLLPAVPPPIGLPRVGPRARPDAVGGGPWNGRAAWSRVNLPVGTPLALVLMKALAVTRAR